MAPTRNFHPAAVLDHHRGGHEVRFVEQAQRPGFLDRYRLDLGKTGHRLGHFLVGTQVEPDLHPLDRLVLQRGDAFVALARFDRQQFDVRFLGGVVVNFGGAHGGAPDIRRQQTLLEIGKEHGIDQLGLAARKLGQKSEDHAVVAQALGQIVDAQAALDIGVAVVLKPGLVRLDAGTQFVAPLLVLRYLVL